jgi:hypothetical protein
MVRRIAESWKTSGEGGQVQSCGFTGAKEELTLKRAMAEYRKMVWDRGEERGVGEDGVTPVRKGFSREEVNAMIASGGVVP